MGSGLLSPTHLAVVLAVALIVFGPKRLPELGRAIGHGMRGFKDALEGGDDEEPAPLAPPAAETSPAPVDPVPPAGEASPAPVTPIPPAGEAPVDPGPPHAETSPPPAADALPAPVDPASPETAVEQEVAGGSPADRAAPESS